MSMHAAASAALSAGLASWLETELERLGVASASERRTTRDALADRLSLALRGHLVELSSSSAGAPPASSPLKSAERLVVEPLAAALEPYLAVQSQLQQLSEVCGSYQNRPKASLRRRVPLWQGVAVLQMRERFAATQKAYDRRLARRDDKIRVLTVRASAGRGTARPL